MRFRFCFLLATIYICAVPNSALCDTTRMNGKGHFLYSLTGELDPTNPYYDKTSVRRHLSYFRKWQDRYPEDTDGIVAVPDPNGTPIGAMTPPAYSRRQIAKFIYDEGARWLAIKGADGSNILDQVKGRAGDHEGLRQVVHDLKNPAEGETLHVFAWVLLKNPRDWSDELAAATSLINDYGFDGLIIIPKDDDDPDPAIDTSYYGRLADAAEAVELQERFLIPLKTVCKNSGKLICYSPETDILCFDPSTDDANEYGNSKESTKKRSWVNYAFGTKVDVVMPRLFWKGGKDNTNVTAFLRKLDKKWKHHPNTVQIERNPLSTAKLVPILQAEKPQSGGTRVSRINYLAQELKKEASGKKHYKDVIGFAVWNLDEFSIPDDHRAFTKFTW